MYDPQRSASNDPWSLQEFDVFIPILPHTRVLLRADSVPHHKCPGLDEQVSGLLQEVLSVPSHLDGPVSSAIASTSAISTPSGLQPNIPPPPISERHLTASSSAMLQAHAIGTSAPRKIAAVPFPLRYTCDMIEGLAGLASNLSDAKAIDDSGKGKITRKEQAEINRKRTSDAFAVNFKGSKYVRSTFNKALRVYKKALHLDGIIDKYTAYGRSPTGYWSAFEAQVNRQSPSCRLFVSLTAFIVLDPRKGRLPNDDDDDFDENDDSKDDITSVPHTPVGTALEVIHQDSEYSLEHADPLAHASPTTSELDLFRISHMDVNTAIYQPSQLDDTLTYEVLSALFEEFVYTNGELSTSGTQGPYHATLMDEPSWIGTNKDIHMVRHCFIFNLRHTPDLYLSYSLFV